LLCLGIGSFCWAAWLDDPEGIYQADVKVEVQIVVGHEHLDSGDDAERVARVFHNDLQ